MSAGRNTFPHRLVRGWGWLDPFAKFFGAVVGGFYKIPGTRPIKDLMHGTWPLGHALHPALTDVTIGGYTAVLALDVAYLITGGPGLAAAADLLLVLSFVSSLLTIVSGLTDWNETADEERRTGMLHGLLMVVATVGFVASIVMRVNGPLDAQTGAIAISTLSWLVMIVASYFGGELVFGFGTEVNRQAWSDIRQGWQPLDLRVAELEDRKPVTAKTKQGVTLFVSKLDDAIVAMANTCTHAGGPLNEGKWVGKDRCEIECPWHASRFCVKDGSVHGGPATFREPTWETRVSDGQLEVRAKA